MVKMRRTELRSYRPGGQLWTPSGWDHMVHRLSEIHDQAPLTVRPSPMARHHHSSATRLRAPSAPTTYAARTTSPSDVPDLVRCLQEFSEPIHQISYRTCTTPNKNEWKLRRRPAWYCYQPRQTRSRRPRNCEQSQSAPEVPSSPNCLPSRSWSVSTARNHRYGPCPSSIRTMSPMDPEYSGRSSSR